jgi:hypothetical protein
MNIVGNSPSAAVHAILVSFGINSASLLNTVP